MAALGGPGKGIPGYTPGGAPPVKTNTQAMGPPAPGTLAGALPQAPLHGVGPPSAAGAALYKQLNPSPFDTAAKAGKAVTGAYKKVAAVVNPTPAAAPKAKATAAPTPAPTPQPWNTVAKPQSVSDIVKDINATVKEMGLSGSHVPPALALTHIATLLSALPKGAHVPAAFSLMSVAHALKGGPGTPGYVDPQQAATAAAQQGYGAAISGDQHSIAQQAAQNQQNQTDVQNWYASLMKQEQAGAASDAAGYAAAQQGTGVLGGAISGALGFDAGSAGADTIGQTGSILNAAANMAAASGKQFDQNQMISSGLAGIQDLRNEQNSGNQALSGLRNTLNSDQKGKGAAYTTALDAARQANTGNAQQYAAGLSGLNKQYQDNFNQQYARQNGLINSFAALNSQYNTQTMNAFRGKLAGFATAAGVEALPAAQVAAGAKADYMSAKSYQAYQSGQADLIKAQAAKTAADLKANGQSLTANTPAAGKARYGLAGNIFSTISNDPRVFQKDPLTGAVTLKNKKLAMADVGRMLMLAGVNPTSGAGAAIDQILQGMVNGTA